MAGRLIGYARTSTDEQNYGLAAQIEELTKAGCELIYNEQVSSVVERAELDAALAELKAGDKLIVCKLDRLARNLLGFWKVVEALEARGVGLRILNMGGEVVDTKSATGKLILTIFAGFAQFEREMMLERQKPGIERARAEGKYRGRKPKPGRDEVRKLYAAGVGASQIARERGISRRTVYNMLSVEAAQRPSV